MLSIVFLVTVFLNAPVAAGQQFDGTKPLTLKGTVAGTIFGPESFLIVDVMESGKTATWAVQGKSLQDLMGDGWTTKSTVRLGDTVTVTVFRPRPNVNLLANLTTGEVRVIELAKAGRLVLGTDVTLANGTKLTFGDLN
jgi:hypothetical protein